MTNTERAGYRQLVDRLESIAVAGDDIADMAECFIDARDPKSLRNYGANVASMCRALRAELHAALDAAPAAPEEQQMKHGIYDDPVDDGTDGAPVASPASPGERKCENGHVWTNDYGDDWYPEEGRPCDCGQRISGGRDQPSKAASPGERGETLPPITRLIDQVFVAGQMDAQATEKEKWKIGSGGEMKALRDRIYKLALATGEAIEAEVQRLRAELETEQIRLAACTTAALSNTPEKVAERIASGHPYYSASYGDVCRAVDREIKHREEETRLRAERDAAEQHVKILSAAQEQHGAEIARLRTALEVIHTAVRGDEKSECWTIRKWLDERDIFNDDLEGPNRLIEEVCKAALTPPTAGGTDVQSR